MSSDTVKAIVDALRPLAEKLGQGAAHLYEVFVRQQYAVGVGEIVWSLPMLIAVIVFATKARKLYKWDMEDASEGMISTFATIGAVAAAVIGVGLAADAVMHLLNPEYYAVKDLLCQVKSCQP